MKTKLRNYIVTGGFGMIGSAIVNSLPGKVTIVSRSNKNRERIQRKNYRVKLKSILDLKTKDLENIDVIYHCASTSHNYNIFTDPFLDVETNITATIHLLELCKAMKKKPQIIYLSTFYVYGNTYDFLQKPLNEKSPVNPLGSYPTSKYSAEKFIELYGRLFSIPYVICRLTNVYGPEEKFDNPQKGALNYLIMEALKGSDIPLYNGGHFFRDYIYIDDVISALLTVEDKSNEIYVVGSGKSIEFRSIIARAIKLAKSTSKIVDIKPPTYHTYVGTNNFASDVRRIRTLGWKARTSITVGLSKVIARYRLFLS